MACEMNTWKVILLAAIFCLQQHCVLGKVPGLFIFGDSMSDVGNNNQLPTLAKCNYPPYGIDFTTGPTGRFTNGRTLIDILTQLLGFQNFIPPYARTGDLDIMKGVNYASGGAGIRAETSRNLGVVINLGSQLAHHKVIVSQIASKLGSYDKAHEYLKKCLFYVNIGRNDYIYNYFFPIYPTKYIYNPEQYAEALVQELSSNLLALHEMGARKYVLVGLEPLGCTPYAIITNHRRDGSCVEEWNVAGFSFNHKLKSLVDNFNDKFYVDSKFIYINATSLTHDNSHGFPVSKVACCPSLIGGVCIANHKPCYNRSDYVFWDQLHTTEEWNLVTAISSYNASNPSFTYPMDIKHLVDY